MIRISKRQSWVLASGAFLAFALSAILLLQNRKSLTVRINTPSTSGTISVEGSVLRPQIVMSEFHRTETKNGKTSWEIKAKQGAYDASAKLAKLEQATLWLFRDNGEVVKIVAPSALVTIDGNTLTKAHISGGVELQLSTNLKATSDEALLDRVTNTLSVPGKVKIERDRITLQGRGLDVDIENQVFKLARNVETVIQPVKR